MRRLSWLLAALVIGGYVYFFPSPGTSDVTDYWFRWMTLTREHGLVDGYFRSLSDYPPITFLLLHGADRLSAAMGFGPHEAVKGVVILAAFAGGVMFWRWTGSLVAASLLLAAMVLDSAALGYLNSFYLLPLLLAFRALQRERVTAAGAWTATAFLAKWQPIIIAPLVLVYVCQRAVRAVPAGDGQRPARAKAAALAAGRLALGALPVVIAFSVLFGVDPVVDSLARALNHRYRSLSFQGLNVNWIVQMLIYKQQGLVDFAYFQVLPPRAIIQATRVVFWSSYVFLAVTLWRTARGFGDFIWLAVGADLAYCAFSTGVHENHWFLAMVTAFALLAAGEWRRWPEVAVVALIANLNLFVFYGLDGQPAVPPAAFDTVSILLAGAFTLVSAAWLVAAAWRWTPRWARQAVAQ